MLRKDFHWFTVQNVGGRGLYFPLVRLFSNTNKCQKPIPSKKKKKPYVKNSNPVISLKEEKNVYFSTVASYANICLAY